MVVTSRCLAEEPERRRCNDTGLALVSCHGHRLWRVAKTSFGPLNPLLREGGDPMDWGRWDVDQHRTIYGGCCVPAAYAESLAALRVGLKDAASGGLKLTDVFSDDAPQSNMTLLEAVADDWRQRGYMAPGQMAASWRVERQLYRLSLPLNGWLIDVTAADSIAALRDSIGQSLPVPLGEELTAGHLLSEQRSLTTSVAGWLWDQVLEDGSLPVGIRYPSKHGTEWACAAVWLRQVDDGKDVSSEPTQCVGERAIRADDPDLRYVGELFRSWLH